METQKLCEMEISKDEKTKYKKKKDDDKGDLNLPSSAARLNELRTAKARTLVKR